MSKSTTARYATSFRLSAQAYAALERLVKATGLTKTAVVNLSLLRADQLTAASGTTEE